VRLNFARVAAERAIWPTRHHLAPALCQFLTVCNLARVGTSSFVWPVVRIAANFFWRDGKASATNTRLTGLGVYDLR